MRTVTRPLAEYLIRRRVFWSPNHNENNMVQFYVLICIDTEDKRKMP
jgi:hypothetical protein